MSFGGGGKGGGGGGQVNSSPGSIGNALSAILAPGDIQLAGNIAGLTPEMQAIGANISALAPQQIGLSENIAGLAPDFQNMATGIADVGTAVGQIGGQDIVTGGSIEPAAMAEFQAGAAGQLTPAQQALSTEALNQANLGTRGTYAGLGLGDSTMMSEDLGGNLLSNEAMKAGLEAQSQQLGLQGLQESLGFTTAGTGAMEQAGALTGEAANVLGGAENAWTGAGSELDKVAQLFGAAGSEVTGTGNLYGGAESALTGAGNLLGGAGNLNQAAETQFLNSLGGAAQGAGTFANSALGSGWLGGGGTAGDTGWIDTIPAGLGGAAGLTDLAASSGPGKALGDVGKAAAAAA